MKPDYEGATLEVFADLVEKGIVYRDLKPVHWSIANQTALADAELEYFDRKDTSIFVRFNLVDMSALPPGLNIPAGETVSVMIWTTTPWTLPANLAVAVAPESDTALPLYAVGSDLPDHPRRRTFRKGSSEHRDLRCRGPRLLHW